jgi:hypothetical protein
MGRSAHAVVRPTVDHRGVEPRGILHRIEDDLSEDWVEEWAEGGVQAIESYLAKHLAFLSFLDES